MIVLRFLWNLVVFLIVGTVLAVPLGNLLIVTSDLSPKFDPAYVMFDPKTDIAIWNGALPYRPDAKAMWMPRPNAYVFGDEFNEAGYRGVVLPQQKREGVVRIAVIGDSQAFGHGLPDRESWPRRLEEIARQDGHDVEVLNAAVWGHSVVQGVVRFDELVAPLRPDFVLIAFSFINDGSLAPHGRPDPQRIALFGDERLEFQNRVRGLSIYRGLKRVLQPESKPAYQYSLGTVRVPPKTMSAAMIELLAKIRASGATPILVAPWRRAIVMKNPISVQLDEALRAIAVAEDVRLIDLVELRKQTIDAKLLPADDDAMDGPFLDPYHYSVRGHDYVGGLVTLVLRRMGALGPIDPAKKTHAEPRSNR